MSSVCSSSLQLVARLLLLFLVLTLVWSTLIFHYGLLGILCNTLKGFFTLTLISLIFLLIIRIIRISALLSHHSASTGDITQDDLSLLLWSHDYYTALYVLHNLASIVWYASILDTAYEMSDSNWYRAEKWIQGR